METTDRLPTRPVMRYHGGKFRLADWIMSHFPSHRTYVEPFGGAASVLMRKPRSHGEVYNDLDDEIVNVMRVLRDDGLRERLVHALTFTPYARREFELAWQCCEDPVERARRTLIRAEMGFGSAGATKQSTGFRSDTKRNHGTAMHVWARLPEMMSAFGARLQGVLIEHRSAALVIAEHDCPQTLFYVDPPYLPSTRERGGRAYRHEMSEADHVALLEQLDRVEGAVVLSGYASPLYESRLAHWTRVGRFTCGAGRAGSVHRTEMLWLSPAVRPDVLDFERAE